MIVCVSHSGLAQHQQTAKVRADRRADSTRILFSLAFLFHVTNI